MLTSLELELCGLGLWLSTGLSVTGEEKGVSGTPCGFGAWELEWKVVPFSKDRKSRRSSRLGLGKRKTPGVSTVRVQLYATPPPVLLESEFLWWSSLGFLRNMHTNLYQCVVFTTRVEFTYPSPTDTLQNAAPVRKSPLGHFCHNVATVPATSVHARLGTWAESEDKKTVRYVLLKYVARFEGLIEFRGAP